MAECLADLVPSGVFRDGGQHEPETNAARGASMSESEIFGRDLRTGEPVPLGKPEWVVTSSLSSPWRNLFKVERHLRPAFEREEVAAPASICFFGDAIQEQVLMEWRIPGSPLRGKLLQSGDVNVASEGMPVWANHLGRTDMTGVFFQSRLPRDSCS